tara:strand:- start:1237 stop:1995 length:759 start_codon:yes stop_codon:yes gene_type:complete
MKVTSKDLTRFSRQIILKQIGIIGQKKIFSAKVLVVGAGGLGCPLLLYLANTGVGRIGIVDHDKIELSNLNRQILFNYKDIGKYKVDLTKKRIKEINKKINIKTYKIKIDKKNVDKIFKEYDIICDGTDNFETRYLINDYCLKNKKILISAAISKFDGQIFKFNFKKKTPCFRCFMPKIPKNENNCDTDGIVSTLAGVMGTMQANEVIKTILNVKDDLLGKMIVFNSLKPEFRKIKLSKNPRCINRCINQND